MSLEKWSKENYLHEKKKWDKIGNKKGAVEISRKKQQQHSSAQHAKTNTRETPHHAGTRMLQ